MNLLSESNVSSLKTPNSSIQVSSNQSPLSSLRRSLSRISSRSNGSSPAPTSSASPMSSIKSAVSSVRSAVTPSESPATTETSSQPTQSSDVYTTVKAFLPAWLGWMVSIKFVLFVAVCLVIFWQFRPYFSYVNDMINMVKTILESGIGVASATSNEIVESTAKGSTVVVDKIAGKKKPKNTPEPDDSNSSVQGGSSGSYCLAGEWKGVRSCVRVNNQKDCKSGKLFDTKDQCVMI